jgi:hypothetical protein
MPSPSGAFGSIDRVCARRSAELQVGTEGWSAGRTKGWDRSAKSAVIGAGPQVNIFIVTSGFNGAVHYDRGTTSQYQIIQFADFRPWFRCTEQ